jgi:hypothetical protein
MGWMFFWIVRWVTTPAGFDGFPFAFCFSSAFAVTAKGV